jgi:hypothetical protein
MKKKEKEINSLKKELCEKRDIYRSMRETDVFGSDKKTVSLSNELSVLRRKIETKTLTYAQESIISVRDDLINDLTDKQKKYYKVIHKYLKEYVEQKLNIYIPLNWSGRNCYEQQGWKIIIKRIAELLNKKWGKTNFSDLVAEYKSIKFHPGRVISNNYHLSDELSGEIR